MLSHGAAFLTLPILRFHALLPPPSPPRPVTYSCRPLTLSSLSSKPITVATVRSAPAILRPPLQLFTSIPLTSPSLARCASSPMPPHLYLTHMYEARLSPSAPLPLPRHLPPPAAATSLASARMFPSYHFASTIACSDRLRPESRS